MLSDDELFEKMMSKNNKQQSNNLNDDTIFEKMKQKKTDDDLTKLKRTGYDYYKILGVDKNSDISIIKKKYRHLLAKYHPDKLNKLTSDKKSEKLDQIQLIRMAGEILTHPEKKKLYDLEQKTIRTNNFAGHKESFEDFLKLQESNMTEEHKQKSLLDFKHHTEKMNKLRNFDPSSTDKLDTKNFNKNITDLQAQRDIENIELSQKNMFDGRGFNPVEFNKVFEKNKKKEEKKLKKKQERGELVNYNDNFTAFNDGGNNFISVNDDYGELFGDDQFRDTNMFSKTHSGLSDVELSDSDMSDDDNSNDDYNNHKNNKLKTNDFDKLLAKRREEDFNFDPKNIKKDDFFKDVMHDQFGISKDFGVLVGNDLGTTKPTQITSHMAKIYNKLIKHSSDDE